MDKITPQTPIPKIVSTSRPHSNSLGNSPAELDRSRSTTPKLEIESIPILPPPERRKHRNHHHHHQLQHNRNRSLPILNLHNNNNTKNRGASPPPSSSSTTSPAPEGPRSSNRASSPLRNYRINGSVYDNATDRLNNERIQPNRDSAETLLTFEEESHIKCSPNSSKSFPLLIFSPLLSYLNFFSLKEFPISVIYWEISSKKRIMGKITIPAVIVPYIWPTSPSSFFTGVLCGLFIAWIRPTLEYYLDIWAQYVATLARFVIIWGSIAVVCWGLIRIIQSTSAATMNIPSVGKSSSTSNPVGLVERPVSPISDNASIYTTSSYSSDDSGSERSYGTYSSSPIGNNYRLSTPKSAARDYASSISPSSSASNSKIKSKEKDMSSYAYRPYPSRPTLSQTQSEELSRLKLDEHLSVLEKPVGQSAFRLHRK